MAARRQPSRLTRRLVLAGAGLTGAALGGLRFGGYADRPSLLVLSDAQAATVAASAEVIVPRADEAQLTETLTGVDRYLVAMPEDTLRELGAALLVVEQLTVIGGSFRRFSDLDPSARGALLDGLVARDDLLEQCYLALRELCMLGYYQQPSSWKSLGYEGPKMPPAKPRDDPDRIAWPRYDALRAEPGVLPEAAS